MISKEGNDVRRSVVTTSGAACDEHIADHVSVHEYDNIMCGCEFEDGSDHGYPDSDQSAVVEEQSECAKTCATEESEATVESDIQGTYDTRSQEIKVAVEGTKSVQCNVQESKDLDKEVNERDEPNVDGEEESGPKWRLLARRAGPRTAERAELIAQQLAARYDRLRDDRGSPPDWQQQMVDELNTFLAWLAHGLNEECTFEDYQGGRPPLRPRRRRNKR